MLRRTFLNRLGLSLGLGLTSTLVHGVTGGTKAITPLTDVPVAPGDWKTLRSLFPLTHDYIQLATFLLASHPKPVSDAIDAHRKAFDLNPADYWHEHFLGIDKKICESAASYMGGKAESTALTDSTTMGLGLVYSGLKLNRGDEILQTTHDHYSTDMSLAHRANRTGAKVRQVALYDDPAKVDTDVVLSRLKAALTDNTRVVAVTWVHSSTGVKLPIHDMAQLIAKLNRNRKSDAQILFCVDGVHGFGIEDVDVPVGEHMSPGGFHSFEHRWALPEAFNLHLQLGKANVQQRIHQLNTQTKQGLAAMKNITLYTPMATEMSSGLVCFDVDGIKPEEVVKRMHKKGIIMSNTPYRKTFARFAPSLLNNEQEIDTALAAIRSLKS